MKRLAAALLVAAGAADAADPGRGAELYRQHCVSCHGPAGRPALPGAPDLTRPAALLKPDPVLAATLGRGRGGMPGYAGLLKERELYDLIAHLRTFR